MKNKGKRGGAVFIAGGGLLLAAAFLLAGYNLLDEHRAGVAAAQVLKTLQVQIQGPSSAPEEPSSSGAESPDFVLTPDKEMPVTDIEGNDYIGILEIPALDLSLPVMSEWSYPKLKIAPCRYHGSAYSGSLVIAAHNYSTHFGKLKSLAVGAPVWFTDVQGHRFLYEAAAVEVLGPTAADDMLSGEWDLTLFTCTPGGQARVAVRCIRAG